MQCLDDTDNNWCSRSLIEYADRIDGRSDQYFSGTSRQFWSYQAGEMTGPPFTTTDARMS